MVTLSDNDEIPFPLVRRANSRPVLEDAELMDGDGWDPEHALAIPEDRMSPAVSGGLAGLVAGPMALGMVHVIAASALGRLMAAAAAARGVDLEVAIGIAYVTTAAIGALVGATFAFVTRYLRKWVPLLIWALVFFSSLAMLLLAVAVAYGRGVSEELSGPVLLGSAFFGSLVSFSLPIRRRR